MQQKKQQLVPGSNWTRLASSITKCTVNGQVKKRTRQGIDKAQRLQLEKDEKRKKKKGKNTPTMVISNTEEYLAMDCEMVGVGIGGKRSVLARCSIVDYFGTVVYDEIVQPLEKVTDFRTHVSGIRSKTLRKAIDFRKCQKEVGKILKDKIVVGHALKNDFQVLMFNHPKEYIRDTSKYRPFMSRRGTGSRLYPRSLKNLVKEVLETEIQSGEHNSVEDAQSTMKLFKTVHAEWEKALKSSKKNQSLIGSAPPLTKTEPMKKVNLPIPKTENALIMPSLNEMNEFDE